MKPVIIYVSGAPGSGKTTLAKQISEQLTIHHISSDLIQGGVAYRNLTHERADTIVKVFIPYLIKTAELGISFVVDHVLQKDIARETVIEKLLPHARIIYLHTQATDPIARYRNKIINNTSPEIQSRQELLLARSNFHAANLPNTINPIDLGVPTLIIDTNDNYSPSLKEIIQFIQDNSQGR